MSTEQHAARRASLNYPEGVLIDQHDRVFAVTLDHGVVLREYDRETHAPRTQSYLAPETCAHGGQDTCSNPPLFSVTSPAWSISACHRHVFGALAQARARMLGS